MKSIIIHSAAIVLLLVSIGFSAKAQENKTSIWGIAAVNMLAMSG